MKHTPGPWKVYQRGVLKAKHEQFEASFWVGHGENEWRGPGTIVDVVHPCHGLVEHLEKDFNEAKANAQLIASAPEMLELLEQVYKRYGDDDPLMHQIANAIEKAGGEI